MTRIPSLVSIGLVLLGALAGGLLACGSARPGAREHTVVLEQGWALQAADRVAATGAAISKPGFDPAGWQRTAVPSTVLGALVTSGVYPDPLSGRNLERIDAGQFKQPWWYRTEFTLDASGAAGHARLVFEGINYSAEVWLNGDRVADRSAAYGAFRILEFDVTGRLRDGVNALAVEVFPPRPGDFTIGFVDWNPPPPDANLGLWRPVKLRVAGAVGLDDVFVQSSLDERTLASATLRVDATVTNSEERPVEASLAGRIGEVAFATKVALQARERRRISLSGDEVRELRLDHPRLWWPNQLGEPYLYRLELEASVGGRVSDRQEVSFGVRSVSDYLDAQGHRGYRVNGRPVLIRGGGWVDDLFLREDPERLEAAFAYARHMNLNTIRLEGFWGSSQRLYDLADRYGIMLMAGFSCQWEWEDYLGKKVDETYGGVLTPEDQRLVGQYFRDQVTWLRNHPSIFVWVVGSDMLPRPEQERAYRASLAELDPTRPLLAACSTRTSEVSGPSGVKMNGPYDYVTPNYWYVDRERGGGFGFNTETGPGPQPPPIESLRRMLGADHLWPIDAMWDYHCARHEFGSLRRYLNALDRRYGPSASAEEFARKAQVANYEAIRAMFEAFAVNRPATTGIIQWMYNAAWPKLFWQLYDYYLVPNGAYFGTRKACQAASLVFDYGNREIVAVNLGGEPLAGVKAEVRVLDLASRPVLTRSLPVSLAPDSSARLLELPADAAATPVYFLDLRLVRPDGGLLASNFYWLSARPDELDFPASTWFVTPNRAFADFTALATLPPVAVEVAERIEAGPAGGEAQVTLRNPSKTIAFFIELRLVGERSGQTLVPVLWEDNYLSLLPGEERRVSATVMKGAVAGERPALRVAGWNVRTP